MAKVAKIRDKIADAIQKSKYPTGRKVEDKKPPTFADMRYADAAIDVLLEELTVEMTHYDSRSNGWAALAAFAERVKL
jgi:hypothetical protein